MLEGGDESFRFDRDFGLGAWGRCTLCMLCFMSCCMLYRLCYLCCLCFLSKGEVLFDVRRAMGRAVLV